MQSICDLCSYTTITNRLYRKGNRSPHIFFHKSRMCFQQFLH